MGGIVRIDDQVNYLVLFELTIDKGERSEHYLQD